MTEKKFLQETNFADEIEEIEPEKWDAEASNKAIKAHNERIWSDANLRDGSYWHISETKTQKREKRLQILDVSLVSWANFPLTQG